MKINIINDLNSYKEIFKKYNLIKKDINFYQTFEFISNYANYYNNKLHIYLIEENNNFIILPLNVFNFKFINYYGFIGSPSINEENNIIHNFKNFDEFSSMLNYFFFKEKKKFFFLNLTSGFFNNYLSNNNSFYNHLTLKSNTVDLTKEYFVNKKSYLNEILYYERRYQKEYKDYISIHNLNLQEAEKFNVFNFIKNNHKYKNSKITKMIKFYKKMFNLNLVKISLLRSGNDILSIIIYTLHSGKIYYLIPVYNKEFFKFSFGKMHLSKFLDLNVGSSKSIFLGPGDELYKKKFIIKKNELYFYSNSKILKSYYEIKNVFK
tara:strand:- start:276 stop:1238 length:963 start_codon:yes stop_codon:yes gene_type:complete